MVSGRRISELALKALVGDVTIGLFIAGGWITLLFLIHYPGEYGLWLQATLAIPSLFLGRLISAIFKRAETRWKQLRFAFWLESKAAGYVLGSFLYIGLYLFLNVAPDFGWLIFGLGGSALAGAFLLGLVKLRAILSKSGPEISLGRA